MKRCPKCQRTYPDDAPGFCVNDGMQLVTEEPQAYDPQKTIMATPPPAAPPPQYNPAPPPPAPPPPQPYQNPNEPAGMNPQQQWQPQPPPPQQHQPPAAPWPPPPPQQQPPGQWGGGGYYPQQPGQQYGAPYAPQMAGQSKSLSLMTIIIGGVSGLLGLLLLGDYLGWFHIFDRDTGYAAIIGAIVTGVAALVTGALALISKRQVAKPLAIVGMLLAAFSIGFWIYLEVEYGILFS